MAIKVEDFQVSGELAVHVGSHTQVYVSAGTAATVTVPKDPGYRNAGVVIFSATGNFYIDPHGGTAAVPAATDTGGDNPMLNPAALCIQGDKDSFSIIAATGVVVTMTFYKAGF